MRRLRAVLFAIAPFVAAAIAALSARHDLRLLWMAVAATVAVRLVVVTLRRQSAFVAFVTGLVAAALIAVLLGARGVVGVGAVRDARVVLGPEESRPLKALLPLHYQDIGPSI